MKIVEKKDLLGKRFGRLVVTAYLGVDKWRKHIWACMCDCGRESSPRESRLLAGTARSCGCLRAVNCRDNPRVKIHPIETRYRGGNRKKKLPYDRAKYRGRYNAYHRAKYATMDATRNRSPFRGLNPRGTAVRKMMAQMDEGF